jgi:DNA polymerase-3 subunit gamma/tau
MAYEVTATRKRPRDFQHMVGQEFVVASLSNSLKTGRIAHAYLFSGPRGVGKTSAARILARALNCPEGPNPDGCEEYPGSEEIARGTSMDVIEIDGASNTSVNDIRTIKDEVLFPPQGSRYKIYIIDEVHMLSNSAFNALLKTIEEPPPYIIFIFATTEIHKVPATIRSRCQQFHFRLIPQEEIVSLLTEAAQEQGIMAEREALSWIAKESTGSLRDAYTLYDQVVSFCPDGITIQRIREKLGILGMDRINQLAELLVQGKSSEALETFDELMALGISLERFIEDITDYFRSLLLLKNGIRRESLLGFSPQDFSHLVQDRLSVAQIERLVDLLLQVYRNIRYTMNPRFEMEVWISKAAGITRFLPISEVIKELKYVSMGVGTSNSGNSDSTDGSNHGNHESSDDAKSLQSQDVQSSQSSSNQASKTQAPVTQASDTLANSKPNPSSNPRPNQEKSLSVPALERFKTIAAEHRDDPPATNVQHKQPTHSSGVTHSGSNQPGQNSKTTQNSENTQTDSTSSNQSHQEEPEAEQNKKQVSETLDTPESADQTDPDQSAVDPNVVTSSHVADVLAHLRRTNITLATSLEKAVEWRIEETTLAITFTHQMPAKMVQENLPQVKQSVEAILMPGLSVEVRQRAQVLVQEAELDPHVQMAQDIFKGTVIEN